MMKQRSLHNLLRILSASLLAFVLVACGGENSDPAEAVTPVTDSDSDQQCEANESIINFSGLETISSVTNTTLQLNWSDHTDAQGYAVFDVTDGNLTYLKFVDAPATSASVSGLTADTNYTFMVKSVDSEFKQDANTQQVSVTTSSTPPDQLLDSISNAVAVYSVRKLSNAYTGNAIAVRRDSDDSVADIGFDGYDLDVAALNAHLGGANGYVETWYDQSGSGNDITQTNTSYQPLIEVSGTPSGQPAVRFDGTDDYLINTSLSYTARSAYFVYEMLSANQSSSDLAQLWGQYGSPGIQVAPDPRSAGTISFDGSGSTTADYAFDGNAFTGSFQENPTGTGWSQDTTHILAVEFGSDVSLSQSTVGSLFPDFSVGTHQFGGDISEIIIFSDAKSGTDKGTIEASQAGYFQ